MPTPEPDRPAPALAWLSPRHAKAGATADVAVEPWPARDDVEPRITLMDIPPKFIADGNVGRLARRLRMLGFDVLFAHPIADDELVAVAERDGRILLTRDTYILHRRVVFEGQVKALLITKDDVRQQLRQVIQALNLRPPFAVFSRCMECNEPLVSAPREEVRSDVPPYVLRTQAVFTRCPRCRRIYWPGTHRDHMLREIEAMVADALADEAT